MSNPENWKITATRPVLIVSDIDRAVDYYTGIGFEEIFRNDVVYSVLSMDEHIIHLGTKMGTGAGLSAAVVEMSGVNEYFAFLTRRNVRIHREPADQFYGMRDFQVMDPDGNIITFGEPLKDSNTVSE